jgi:hypothetical protein
MQDFRTSLVYSQDEVKSDCNILVGETSLQVNLR